MPKLRGHVLQLLGYALTFLGLGVAAATFLAAGSYPAVSTWAFVAAAVVFGAPLMIAGGRINNRGRALVLDQSPEHAAAEYRQQNILLALYIAFLWAHGFLVAAPLLICATGLLHPSDPFVRVWVLSSMLILCAGRQWLSRPVWCAIERRVLAANQCRR